MVPKPFLKIKLQESSKVLLHTKNSICNKTINCSDIEIYLIRPFLFSVFLKSPLVGRCRDFLLVRNGSTSACFTTQAKVKLLNCFYMLFFKEHL